MTIWTRGQQQVLGWYYFIVSAITLLIALAQQPLDEWGNMGLILGAVLGLLGVVGLVMGLTGKDISLGIATINVSKPSTRYSSRLSPKAERTWAVVGLVAVSIAVVGGLISDLSELTASDTISVGIWVALGGLFIAQFVLAGRHVNAPLA